MKTAKVRHRGRLAIRIYLVSAASLIAVSLALYGLAVTVFRPPRGGGPFFDEARYASSEIAARWEDREALTQELWSIRSQLRLTTSAYLIDGTLVASTAPEPLPKVTDRELAELRLDGMVLRGDDCDHDECQIVLAVPGRDGLRGFVVFQHTAGRGGPPPFGAILAILVAVALAAAAGLLGRDLAGPLDRIARTAHALGAGDLKARTGLSRKDELGAVAREFDEMAERVERLVLAQTELLADVAHELRTPLARIRVALDLAENGDASVARESLSEIAQDLDELEALVSDILASARMDLASSTLGAPPLRVTWIEIDTIVNRAVERLTHRKPTVRVQTKIEPGLPGVEGDGPLLRRVLDNLLDNAEKYSATGSPIWVHAFSRGGEVAIEVIDSGEGIPPEDLERLFTPFFRGDKSRTRATGGVGLGLHLARRIIDAHGGTLVAESTVDVGTTMRILLPAAKVQGEGSSRIA